MNVADQFMLALTIWRENRGGGRIGMQSVANVVMNRVSKRHTSAYEECTARLQFSSITAPGDPQLANWPAVIDSMWQEAQLLAAQACGPGGLTDITDGATNYYAVSIPEPDWAKKMQFTVEIADQRFYK